MSKPLRFLTLIMILAFSVLSVFAQRAEESVQVTVIEVPVTVTDRAGNPVRGLTKENFELFDEKKRKPITFFETIDLATLPKESDEPLPPAVSRNFLLLFDLSHSSPTTIGRARDAAKEFVSSQMGHRDRTSVATFSVEQGIRMLTSFTTNRELLSAAIDTLGHPDFFRVTDPLFIS
ncbi:MAG: VWA domain-containing protein, partial [Acidobacteria bacterium]|nr:VWA domain-containing protein [Acidobacteriota bacterium]